MFPMRWIRFVVLLIIGCVVFLGVVFASPLLYTHILHTAAPLWMQHLRQKLLPDGIDVMEQPYTWVMLTSMVILYILVSIDSRFRRYTPYGSARFASRREARRFKP